MGRATRILGGSLGAVFLGVTLMRALFDAYGHVDQFLAWFPAPVSRFVSSANGTVFLVVVGLAVLFVALRYQSHAGPRLVVGYVFGRGQDYSSGVRNPIAAPFYLRNDGSDTALNIVIHDATVDGAEYQFEAMGTQIPAGDDIDLHIYAARKRVDLSERSISSQIEQRILLMKEQKGHQRIEIRVPVRVEYKDHQHKRYSGRYDILLVAEPIDGGKWQMCLPSVEISRG